MKKLLLFVFAVLAFTACEQAPIEEQSAIRQDAPETITVGFEGDATRIQLNEAQKTVWTKGDQVSVFYKSDANQKYEYRGETGERTAELHKVSAGSSTIKMGYVVVAYPYSEEYIISPASGNLETMLPAVQHYAVDSYGVGDNLMVSCSEFTQFSLKSVCGWLKLQLTGNGEVVKSITLRGNDGEQVAGELYINTSDATCVLASASGDAGESEVGGTLVRPGTILTEVTLDCGDGVTLGAETTAFYITLPPQTFENGFTVEIEDTEGYVMEQSTDKALLIERNTIKPMAAFEFINPNRPTQPTPASNEIWYTSSNGKVVTPYKTNVFGANIISNTYNNGMGVITFDGDVTTIGYEAFRSCDSLTSVNIPDSVTTIGEGAFYYCTSLTSVNIPDSVTTIGYEAFTYCYSLTSITIPDSVSTIGERAFTACTSLTSVNIPDSVTTIENEAFRSCDSLTSVNIPDSVTSIGDYAFSNCDSLTSVNIPDSVTSIGYQAFASCDSLTSVNIGDSVTTIGEAAFSYCDSLTSVNIPDSVTSIGEWAFYNCDSLTSVNIPDSVTSIGDYTFQSCDSLTSVNIPDSVTSIGYQAFYYCTSLTSVNIPDSVITIGDYAFSNCTSLTSVYCKSTTPPSLGESVFDYNGSGRKIYVPAGSVNAYKRTTNWRVYDSRIVGYNFENGVVVE